MSGLDSFRISNIEDEIDILHDKMDMMAHALRHEGNMDDSDYKRYKRLNEKRPDGRWHGGPL